jgi:hypothetical protein
VTFTDLVGGRSGAAVPSHNRLRGLEDGNPHPQYTLTSNGPAGVLGVVTLPAVSQGSITTEVDVTGSEVTFTVGTGRQVKVSAIVSYQNTAGAGLTLTLREGATRLQVAHDIPVGSIIVTVPLTAVLAPTAGEHTYKLCAANYGGGTVTLQNVGGTYPDGFLLVEDIGPS